MYRSVSGLMDYADPERTSRVQAAIEPLRRDLGFVHHGLRVRNTGHRTLVEVHLLFPFAVTLGDAHRRATVLERHLSKALDEEVEVMTHLESLEDHAAVHRGAH
jgi:divalent metal cation (Fe/Co/Zn/Cd) transporter